MSSWVIAMFFSVGACAWIYPKLNSRTGNTISGQVLLVTGLIGLFIFVIMGTLINMLAPN